MLLCCLGLIATGIGTSFAPTFDLYVFTRFLVGLFSVTCFIAFYVYGKTQIDACAAFSLKHNCNQNQNQRPFV